MIETDKRTPGRWVCPNQCESIDTEATPIGAMLECPKCGASGAVVARFEIAPPATALYARREEVAGTTDAPGEFARQMADGISEAVRLSLGVDPALPGSERNVRTVVVGTPTRAPDIVSRVLFKKRVPEGEGDLKCLPLGAVLEFRGASPPAGWTRYPDRDGIVVANATGEALPSALVEEIRAKWQEKFGCQPSDRLSSLRKQIAFRERRTDPRMCGANIDHKASAGSTDYVVGRPYVTVCAEPGCNWFEVAEYHGMQPPYAGLSGWFEVTPRLSGFVIVEDDAGPAGATLSGKAKANRLRDVFAGEWGDRIVERSFEPCCPDGCRTPAGLPVQLNVSASDGLRNGQKWEASCRVCSYREAGTVVDASCSFTHGTFRVHLVDPGEKSSPGVELSNETSSWTLVRSDRVQTRHAVEEALADVGAAFCEAIRAAVIELIDRNGAAALDGLAIARSDAQRAARGIVSEAACRFGRSGRDPHDHRPTSLVGLGIPHRHDRGDEWTITVKEINGVALPELTEDSIINRR